MVTNRSGKFYAIGNTCTHRGCRLSEGKVDGDQVKCRCHGSVFDLRTGKVIHGPAVRPEPAYGINTRDEKLWIEVG